MIAPICCSPPALSHGATSKVRARCGPNFLHSGDCGRMLTRVSARDTGRRGPTPVRRPFLPHQSCGDPDCCGLSWGVLRADQPDTADIIGNDCKAIVRTVPGRRSATHSERDGINPRRGECTTPPLRKRESISGVSEMLVFVCNECGESVRISDHCCPN